MPKSPAENYQQFINRSQTRYDIAVTTTNWFANRCPLVTRIPRLPWLSATFQNSEITQYCQTWKQAVDNKAVFPSKPATSFTSPFTLPFDPAKMSALQNLLEDMEISSYYGVGHDGNPVGEPHQKGLRTLIGNKTLQPKNARNYTPIDLIRDTLDKCRSSGGDPDVLLVSVDFLTGLATWGHPAQRIDVGVTVFGEPIDVFETSLLKDFSIISAPLLKMGSVICLTSSEIRLRMQQNEIWNPRENSDDGDWVAAGAIEVDHVDHHAWVEGITGFATA